jgi:leucyl aminopeptidase
MSRRSALRWLVPLLLSIQIGLLWLQGAQLHQQNQQISQLRADIQDLADSLDTSQDDSAPQDEDSGVVPLRQRSHRHPRFQRVAVLGLQDEKDSAADELRAAQASAQKAVKDAREAQSKVSIEENARKAEEARKVQGATAAWQKWSIGAAGLLCLAWLLRSWFRRR